MKIISRTGNDWSGVSKETESTFNSWLLQSDISKNEFLTRVNKDSFRVIYVEDIGIDISIADDIGTIGLPIVWRKNSGIPRAYFKIDAALFLIYISSMCNNDKTKRDIEYSIKIHKLYI